MYCPNAILFSSEYDIQVRPDVLDVLFDNPADQEKNIIWKKIKIDGIFS